MRDWFGHKARVLRLGIPALALYALILQAFLTGAAPAAPFHPESVPLCADVAAGAQTPAPADSAGHEHDCLCLAQCLQAQATVGLLSAQTWPLLLRSAQILSRGVDSVANSTLHPLERGPGARAPPQV